MLDQSDIANRLREVRELYGIKEEKVADSLDLSRKDVVDLESGKRPVSAYEITRLAEIYRCSAAFLLSKEHKLNKDHLSVFLHKKFSELNFRSELKTTLWQLFDLYVEIKFLQKTLNKPVEKPRDYSLLGKGKFKNSSQIKTTKSGRDPVNSALESWEAEALAEGKLAAQKERNRHRLGSEPVLDPAKLISKQGISIAETKLPNKLRGLFVKHPDVGLIILVNQKDSPERKRFAYLHEFAHALFDRSDKIVMMARTDFEKDIREARADAFAEEFLMPEKEVAKWFKQSDRNVQNKSIGGEITCDQTAIFAQDFGVEYQAVIKRLVNLKFIHSKQETDLNQNKRRIKRSPHFDLSKSVGKEPSDQLRELVFEAFLEKKISRGRFIEIGRKIDIDHYKMFDMLATF